MELNLLYTILSKIQIDFFCSYAIINSQSAIFYDKIYITIKVYIERKSIIMTNAEKAIALHKNGMANLGTTPKMMIATRQDLALAYTPGVAEPCKIIA